MTRSYCIETIAEELSALALPFAPLIARCLVSLLSCRKATIHHVANALPAGKSCEANRQQIRRFLDHPALGSDCFAKAIAALLPFPSAWVLAIDRTQWNVGQNTINLLVLSVIYGECAVPLVWYVLDKPGNSDTHERIALVEEFIALFGEQKIAFITADREFIGQDWVAWLLKKKIAFRIRIKAGEYLTDLTTPKGVRRRAWEWFSRRADTCLPKLMQLWGMPVYVGGKRLTGKNQSGHPQFLIVISNQVGDLLEDYRKRWKIETLFQAFKGRGFDLESSRLVDWSRLWAWFGFLSFALLWCLKTGEFLEGRSPLPLKRHGRRAQSIFRRGLDHLQTLLAPLAGKPDLPRFRTAISLLRVKEA